MKIHEMGAAAHLRAAKLKTHLPPHAIQSRKRLQVGGGRGCGGGWWWWRGKTIVVKK